MKREREREKRIEKNTEIDRERKWIIEGDIERGKEIKWIKREEERCINVEL